MFGVRKLLVGVDLVANPENPDRFELPAPTREAVEMGLRVGEFSQAGVTFLSVIEPLPAGATEDEQAEVTASAQAALAGLLSEAAERGVQAETQVASGHGWMEMISEVLRNGHQMVIVGSRDASTASRLWLGSTAIKLLRLCPCPVWVARSNDEEKTQTIVVADDLTDVGQHCLHLGVSAARLLHARLLALHAVQYPLERHLRRIDSSPEELREYRETTCAEAEKQLNERLAMTDFRTISEGARTEITAGRPDVVIQDAIEEHEADLLVMGTVARGGIPGMLVGNTAERLLNSLSCSVIAVKPEGFVCPVQLD